MNPDSGEHVGLHDPRKCEGAWCSTCLNERAVKATARRTVARRGAETRKRRGARG